VTYGARTARRRRHAAGFTLIELLVAIGILAMIATLVYGAFAGLKSSRDGLMRVGDRYREGRLAMTRVVRDLKSAYLSLHAPIDQSLAVWRTAFSGTRGNPADRVDFNSFSYQRRDKDSHESDECELSYFGSTNPDQPDIIDLARRVTPRLDLEPERGGRVEVLATDIDLFNLEYLDPLSGEWLENWDTTQAIGQANRLPLQVRVILVLNEGARSESSRGRNTVRFATKVTIPIQNPLTFATSL
jgi:general secretion pathway protein J